MALELGTILRVGDMGRDNVTQPIISPWSDSGAYATVDGMTEVGFAPTKILAEPMRVANDTAAASSYKRDISQKGHSFRPGLTN